MESLPVTETPMGESPHPFDRVLKYAYTLNWEVITYLVVLALAVLTRFVGLGDRVMSHDESLHTKFSWDLYEQGRFQHTPLMHGPLLFHMTAFFYMLFGVNDFSARIYPALVGVLVVMMPVLFRRWLGRVGAVLTAVLFLASPMLMYYSRYIRHDLPAIFFALLMLYAIIQYIDGAEKVRGKSYWLVLLAAAMSLLLASKEVGFIYIAIFGSFLTLYWVISLAQRYLKLKGGRSLLVTISTGIIVGSIAALALIIVFSIIPLSDVDSDGIPNTSDNCVNIANAVQVDNDGDGIGDDCQVTAGPPLAGYIVTSTLAIAAILGVVLLGTALWVMGGDGRQFPWREIVIIVLVALLVCAMFLIIEEGTRTEPVTATPADPGSQDGAAAGPISTVPIILAYVFGMVIVGLAIAGHTLNFWDELRKEPIFDVLIMMGTLVLPWLTAFVIYAAGANPTDYTQAGIVRAAASLVPFLAVSIAVGLAWNWRAWLPAAGVFFALYAIFFTTLFTNGQGLATGIIGSLGYWLEQQGVRRGNQPQYYYTLIMTPFYEFLPLIGGATAGVYGLIRFWRSRKDYLIQVEVEALDAPQSAETGAVIDDPDATVIATRNRTEDLQSVGVTPEAVRAAMVEDEVVPDVDRPSARMARLTRVPFMLFVGYWAVFNVYAYTLSGEKMPWLTTHITVPLIMVTGWFGGQIIEHINLKDFRQHGWKLLLLLPLLVVTLGRVLGMPFGVEAPFQGETQAQLLNTGLWLAALFIVVGVAYAVYRVGNYIGWRQVWRLMLVSIGIVLLVITFRSAFMATFINYDLATEFLVYAHAGPGHTTLFDWMKDISERTTGGMDLRVAYDYKMSWPGSWYFREFPNAVYFDRNPSVQVLDDAIVVVIGSESRGQTEPLLGDRYEHYEMVRMWWPMQDYFGLTWARVSGSLDLNPANRNASLLRQGLWDIWWNRDYTTYGQAVGRDFSLTHWPVSETMHVYVRKDVAAQVWDLGIGAEVTAEFDTSLAELWTLRDASLVWGQEGADAGQFNHPRGVAVGLDGRVYVADSLNHRIQVFDQDGQFLQSWGVWEVGEYGTAAGGNFNQPWGIDVGPEGNIYVADTWNHRVQVFTPDGEFIRTWGQLGQLDTAARVDQFWGPRDVAVDTDGNVYVADTGNKRIRVYTSEGEFVRDIGSGGTGAGQLNEPVGLAMHSDGRLFVADTWNRRIQVFNQMGQYLNSWVVTAWYGDQGNRPYLALDEERGQLYVTDPDAARVIVYDLNGTMLGSFGQPGPDDALLTAAQFNVVGGIAIDASGNVFVADAGRGRLLRFDPWDEIAVRPLAPPEALDQSGEGDVVTDEVTEEPTAEMTEEPTEEVTEEPVEPTTDPLEVPAVEETEESAG